MSDTTIKADVEKAAARFWPWARAAWTRAVRTAAQSITAVIAANASGILGIDWKGTLAVAGGAAVVSLLTSIGGLPETQAQP